MKIEMRGLFVTLEKDDDWDDLLKLSCTCGHNMFSHGSPLSYNEHGQVYYTTSQCIYFGEHGWCGCKQFEVEDASSN